MECEFISNSEEIRALITEYLLTLSKLDVADTEFYLCPQCGISAESPAVWVNIGDSSPPHYLLACPNCTWAGVIHPYTGSYLVDKNQKNQ